MTEFSDLAPDDQQAIGKTLLTLLKGFRDRNAEALNAMYSDDADWVNAFGTVKRGREEIVDHRSGLFADDNFNRGEPEGPPETSFRVLTPEVVLVSEHLASRIAASGRRIVGHHVGDVPGSEHPNHLRAMREPAW